MTTVYRNFFAMGTRFDLVLPGIEEQKGDYICSLVTKEVNRIQELLSNYNESSVLTQLNKSAFHSPFHADDELFELICRLKKLHVSSLGFFDITLGNYKDYGDGTLKSEPKVNKLSLGLDDLITVPGENSVRFARQEISIDSGGFGKGFALEKVKKILMDYDILQAFLSFGESSLMALGDHPFGEGWKIGIPDIYSSESVYVFHLKNSALSVSGNTLSNRNKYPRGHIINPLTGEREIKTGIVCVSGPSPFEVEILSTALFISGENQEKQILGNFPGCKAVRISYSADNNAPYINEIDPKH